MTPREAMLVIRGSQYRYHEQRRLSACIETTLINIHSKKPITIDRVCPRWEDTWKTDEELKAERTERGRAMSRARMRRAAWGMRKKDIELAIKEKLKEANGRQGRQS